ncbi:hypothetical protein AFL42_07245 [Oceanobacillus caeni]|uniref:Uncharacterized protein n=1 Tax=Oceanobacillus caeni TaxID=405946 RepID=A0ABR5MK37_9BACI|nr:hypothetical protein AFL42_07245 [Oceanobacillus caeni]
MFGIETNCEGVKIVKKIPEKILAEMEYIQETIDAKELEVDFLKKKLLKLQGELANTMKETN